MAYKVDRLPDKPVIILTLTEHFRVAKHVSNVIREVTHHLDQADQPLYYISDARDMIVHFGDVINGLDKITRGAGAFVKHPNIREIIIISDNNLVQLGGKALGQRQYGGLKVSMFTSIEEALNHIDEELQTA